MNSRTLSSSCLLVEARPDSSVCGAHSQNQISRTRTRQTDTNTRTYRQTDGQTGHTTTNTQNEDLVSIFQDEIQAEMN